MPGSRLEDREDFEDKLDERTRRTGGKSG